MSQASGTRSIFVERVLLFLATALIVIGAFQPLWGMTLVAPQYPEGLRVVISASTMTGDIDIINTLNHYVGMKDLDGMSFPELGYMRWVILALAALFLLSALIGQLWMVLTTIICSIVIGVVGAYDLYSKLYNYGHQLDPHAPISLPGGFTPPVIGQNQLANFHTYSFFLTGSYLIVVAGVLGAVALIGLWRKRRRTSAVKA